MSELIRTRPKSVRYTDLVRELRSQIASGTLQEGDRLPSFLEMRARHGAAANTVNRAMIALEQEGLIVRKSRTGVFVAPRPSRPRRGVVGCANFLDGRESLYWGLLLRGMRDEASTADTELLLLNNSARITWEKVDGVVLHSTHCTPMLRQLPPGMPAVGLMTDEQALPSVGIDDFQAQYEATKHLIALGHRRIAMLPFAELNNYLRRVAGYRSALMEAGLPTNEQWVFPVHAPVSAPSQRGIGYLLMNNWLDSGWQELGCTAILAQNDGMGQGVVQALHEHGLEVPHDVSVVGFDGLDDSNEPAPLQLTTMEVPLQQMGSDLMRLMLKLIREEPVPTTATLWPVHLRPGASTAPPRQGD